MNNFTVCKLSPSGLKETQQLEPGPAGFAIAWFGSNLDGHSAYQSQVPNLLLQKFLGTGSPGVSAPADKGLKKPGCAERTRVIKKPACADQDKDPKDDGPPSLGSVDMSEPKDDDPPALGSVGMSHPVSHSTLYSAMWYKHSHAFGVRRKSDKKQIFTVGGKRSGKTKDGLAILTQQIVNGLNEGQVSEAEAKAKAKALKL